MATVRQAYHEAVAKFRREYGDKTTVAMMCGSMYNFFDDQAMLANSVAGLNYNSMDMAGFPPQSLEHWCQRFTDQGYVIVVMDQFTRTKKNNCEEIYRVPVAVYGPGTPVELPAARDSAMCAVVFVDDCPGKLGYATFESNTGKTQACEFVEETFEAAFGQLVSAVLADCPSHTLLVCADTPEGDAAMDRFAARAGDARFFGKRTDKKRVDPVTLRDSHVREAIREQFDGCGIVSGSSDTYVGLGGRRYAARAFAHLIHFVFRRDDTKLRIMEPPVLISPQRHLDVAIGGLQQLDVTKDDGLLFHLPRCVTPLGRRCFRRRLCRPSRDPIEIEQRLSVVDAAIPHRAVLRKLLSGVCDFESAFRRLARPAAFKAADFYAVADAMTRLQEASAIVFGERPHHPAASCLARLSSRVDLGPDNKFRKEVAFAEGVYPEFDARLRERDRCDAELDALLAHLNSCAGAVVDPFFKTEANKDGDIEVIVTRKRFENARREIARRDKRFEVAGSTVSARELVVQPHRSKKTDVVVYSDALREALASASGSRRRCSEEHARAHAACCSALLDELADDVYLCARELEDLDVALAGAIMAAERGFVRPAIVSGKGAFFSAVNLRHPVVEALDPVTQYVGNDVSLGCGEASGMLLYGINGSGKSCLMKSVGIAVCMAQAGMYVCADSLRIGLFARLFTRIWNNDDISRGLSTFTVEMTELNEILRRGDSMSLVLGDELCSGTERVSATAIIAAGIETLHAKRCRFLLATHQHDVVACLPEPIPSEIDVKHLRVSLSASGDLVYDRKLAQGSGETTYGVTVCRAIGLPADFLEAARGHALRLAGAEAEYTVSTKQSNYNPDVYMGACARCHKRRAVHTHHIEPQRSASNAVKNRSFNLEVLCAECHETHHKKERAGAAVPTKRVQTSAGVRTVAVDIA
jgi:DNA mismatch repair protein MutS